VDAQAAPPGGGARRRSLRRTLLATRQRTTTRSPAADSKRQRPPPRLRGVARPFPRPRGAVEGEQELPRSPVCQAGDQVVPPHSSALPASARRPRLRPSGGCRRNATSPSREAAAQRRQVGDDDHARRLERRARHEDPLAEGSLPAAAAVPVRLRRFDGLQHGMPWTSPPWEMPAGAVILSNSASSVSADRESRWEEDRQRRSGQAEEIDDGPAHQRPAGHELNAGRSSEPGGTAGRTRHRGLAAQQDLPGGPPFTLRTFFLFV